MAKVIFTVALVFSSCLHAQNEAKKVDWSACKTVIKMYCTKAKSDHDKHECIEKLSADEVSKACREKNESLESMFEGEHGKHEH